MAEFQLHGFGESGNAYKVALYLTLVGADWASVPTDMFAGQQRDPAWRAAFNELGEVPVLQHGETTLTQSGVILDYLVAQCDGAYGWATEDERREVLRWVLFDNHRFSGNLATARFLRRFAGMADSDVTAFLEKRFQSALKLVEKRLTGRDWIALDRASVADLSLAGYLFYDGEIPLDWADWPATAAWRERIRALPGWRPPYDLLPRLKQPAA